VSSTCFEHQVFILRKTCTCSFMVFLSCIHISSLVDPDINQTAYMEQWQNYHKTKCTGLPEDEHLDAISRKKGCAKTSTTVLKASCQKHRSWQLYSNEKNGLQQMQMESCQPVKRLKDKKKNEKVCILLVLITYLFHSHFCR
jgi:hypothetical protein